MKRDGTPEVILFIEKSDNFIQSSENEELGTLFNLVKNCNEPILVFKKGKYKGLISIPKAIIDTRLPYQSKAENQVTTGGEIQTDDSIRKAIKQMVDLGIDKLPVFDKQKRIIGKLTAKNVLRTLIKEKTFLELMILKTEIRKPVTVETEQTIKDVLEILRDPKYDLVILFNNKEKFEGIISKDSFLKAFTKKVETRLWELGNEEIDRDDYPLSSFVKQKEYDLTGSEREDKEDLIKKLVKSPSNNLIILGEKGRPVGIIEDRDLLNAILVKDKTGGMPLKIRGFEELDGTEMNHLETTIGELCSFVNRIDKVENIEISDKDNKTPQGKINFHELMLKVSCYSGNVFISNVRTRSIFRGLKELTEEIKRQLERKVKE